MRTKLVYCIFISCMAVCCTSQRLTHGEKSLLPKSGESKWWLINSITQNSDGKYNHRSLLLSTDVVNTQNFVSFFTSGWAEQDSAYDAASMSVSGDLANSKEKFPLKMDADQASEWNWILSRKKMQIITNVPGKTIDKSQHTTFKFKKQNPFKFQTMMVQPDIKCYTPVMVNEELENVLNTTARGYLFISVITGKDVFFTTAKNKTVIWMNLLLNNGRKVNFLLTVDPAGIVTVNGAVEWDQSNQRITGNSFQISTTENSFVPGNSSGKLYPLCFKINGQQHSDSFLVLPAIIEQEVSANKRSFWMGAVNLLSSESKLRIGAGNMYIFKQ